MISLVMLACMGMVETASAGDRSLVTTDILRGLGYGYWFSSGDFNGDAATDLFVVMPTILAPGVAEEFDGSDVGYSTVPDVVLSTNNSFLPSTGDINQDGFTDAVWLDGSQTLLGIAHGSESGLSMTGTMEASGWGWSALDLGGDWNGDGFADLVAGQPCAYPDMCTVDIYLGSASGLEVPPAASLPFYQLDAAGTAAFAGDINGDGNDDVLVSPGFSGLVGDDVEVFLEAEGYSNVADQVLVSPDDDDFGEVLGAAGDANGDGYDDVLIGVPYARAGGSWHVGRVFLYRGSALGVDETPATLLDGEADYDCFGKSVDAAGDVDGDGFTDLIVGASGKAQAYIYWGSPDGYTDDSRFVLSGLREDRDEFGTQVRGIGAARNDGIEAVAVSAPLSDGEELLYVFSDIADEDGDGYASPADCAESTEAINPDSSEVCDGVDNNCDDLVDDADPLVTGTTMWYADADADGYGDPAVSAKACANPAGYVADSTDCNDGAPSIHPGAIDIPGDGIDQDCDGADATLPDTGADTANPETGSHDTAGSLDTGRKGKGCGSCNAGAVGRTQAGVLVALGLVLTLLRRRKEG